MKKLIKGIVDFRQTSLAEARVKFAKLALGQAPDTLFVACCDSRVAPNAFASTDPGDLFVSRNIGNLVPPYCGTQMTDASVVAALEFSLLCLNVSDIVICGHSECAAMRAIIEGCGNSQLANLNSWLQHAAPAYEKLQSIASKAQENQLAPHNLLSQLNVLQQLEHLKTYPEVKARLQAKQLRIHGWWFDLAMVDVYHYEQSLNNFVLLDTNQAEKILATL